MSFNGTAMFLSDVKHSCATMKQIELFRLRSSGARMLSANGPISVNALP
jgi:hypothetical protein